MRSYLFWSMILLLLTLDTLRQYLWYFIIIKDISNVLIFFSFFFEFWRDDNEKTFSFRSMDGNVNPFRNGSDLPRVTAKLPITYNHLASRPRAVNYAGTSASIIHNQPPLTLRDREGNLYLRVVNSDYRCIFRKTENHPKRMESIYIKIIIKLILSSF